ncbi:Alpha/Beta hydrolase protein [Xylariaceae sp. FL1651]|nr:Alpha/Beta hydrolase protein [Xylariaceae sp. FL1651]
MSAMRRFKIHVPQDSLEGLRQKLALCDIPNDGLAEPEQSSSTWACGVPASEINRLALSWRATYDWRKTEAHLNTFPQFIVSIDVEGFGAYRIHHIHKRSSALNSVSLLFLHGWPWCSIEGDTRTFHAVAPSLIDFGLSSPRRAKGFSFEQHAEAYDELMMRLGYKGYVVQAGDVGSSVTGYMAKKYRPPRCKTYHTDTPAPAELNSSTHPELHAEFMGPERGGIFSADGLGYYKDPTIHNRLLGIYLLNPPGPEAAGSMYYATEHSNPPELAAAAAYVGVPFGAARFRNDLVLLRGLWNRTLGPLVYQSECEKGEHLAAWERPDAIIEDLWQIFDKGGTAREYVR